MNSTRQYRVIGKGIEKDLRLTDLIKKDDNAFEYIYALQDILDIILDLKVGESIFVYLDRGDNNDKGVVFRLS